MRNGERELERGCDRDRDRAPERDRDRGRDRERDRGRDRDRALEHDRGRDRGRDRGSASVELALLAPALLAFAMLMVFAGRVVDARTTVGEAAHAAARAASLERTPAAASATGAAVAAATLQEQGMACTDHSTGVDHGGLVPGGAVTVTVQCTVGFTDLFGVAFPGSSSIEGGATVAVDTFRGTP
ncbi:MULTISPECIES: TadE/TadG family type IV pilus assembly protein [unclassified Nocardiopsis]|uniref:TadE/TadG family type IV pilus assembly protein n=1 Tax=Nocardiopsis TaxID=2013 RepID=UPI00387B6024